MPPIASSLVANLAGRQVINVRVREAREARKEEHISGDALVTPQLHIVQVDDAPQLFLGDVVRCAYLRPIGWSNP